MVGPTTDLQFSSLSEQVYRYLRKELRDGNLRPGATLNLAEIATQLGISKTPLRDALIHLESDGFVTIIPRRGVMVNKLSAEDIREAYEAVGLIESFIVSESFAEITADHIHRLEKLNDKMTLDLSNNRLRDLYDDNLEFHAIYSDLCTNRILKKFMILTKHRIDDYRRRRHLRDWGEQNCREHAVLIDLLKQGNREGAASFLRDVHWSFAADKTLIALIESEQS